jgi:hypothetical protein
MELKEEVAQLRQTGAEKAAVLWEMLEVLPEPISPRNIYKGIASVKSAEFLTRTRNSPMYSAIMSLIAEFMETTILIAGESTAESDKAEGYRVIELTKREMPLTAEIFDDAPAYATRQHVYDALLVLAAVRLGKEEETKEAIHNLQAGVAKAMVMALFATALLEAADETPEDNG